MSEKHKTPEAFFSVTEIYERMDQAIYDLKERAEKFERPLSEETIKSHESALNVIIAIGRMNPQPDSEKKFKDILEEAKESGKIDEESYRLIMQQIY